MEDHRMEAPAGWRELADDELGNLAWDHVDAVSTRAGSQWDGLVSELTPGLRAVFVFSWLDFEVCTGGLLQFLYNSAGNLGGSAVDGLKLVDGASAKRLRQVFARCGLDPYVVNRQEREKRFRDASVSNEEWSTLSTATLECVAAFADHLPAYIRAHPDEFFR